MFCRVCEFRVRVWESYKTSRSFGYGYGSVTELTEVPGIVAQGRTELTEVPGGYKICYTRTPGIVARGVQNSTEVPGKGMNVLQNSQKFRVRV